MEAIPCKLEQSEVGVGGEVPEESINPKEFMQRD